MVKCNYCGRKYSEEPLNGCKGCAQFSFKVVKDELNPDYVNSLLQKQTAIGISELRKSFGLDKLVSPVIVPKGGGVKYLPPVDVMRERFYSPWGILEANEIEEALKSLPEGFGAHETGRMKHDILMKASRKKFGIEEPVDNIEKEKLQESVSLSEAVFNLTAFGLSLGFLVWILIFIIK